MFDRGFNSLENSYGNTLKESIKSPLLLVLLFVVAAAAIFSLFEKIPA
jgi:hypothetical protein